MHCRWRPGPEKPKAHSDCRSARGPARVRGGPVGAPDTHARPCPRQGYGAAAQLPGLSCARRHKRRWIWSQLAAYLALDSNLGTWKGTLTPPNLTAVGDKLRPETLAVRGQAPAARPWLDLNMYTFQFGEGETNAIVECPSNYDRMTSELDPPPTTRVHDPGTIIEAAAALIGFEDAKETAQSPGELRKRFGSFSDLKFEGDGLSISYRLHGPGESLVNVRERLIPTEHGWTRHVRADGMPAGYRL